MMRISSRAAVALLALGLLALAGCSKRDLNDVELVALVTLEDLRAYGTAFPEAQVDRQRRTDWFGGNVQFEYWADTPQDAAEPLSLRTQAGWSSDERNAASAYKGLKVGLRVGAFSLEIEDRSDELELCDESFFGDILAENGQAVGNVFHCRNGRTYLVVMVAGFYSDDPEFWRELLTARLAALEALASEEPATEET